MKNSVPSALFPTTNALSLAPIKTSLLLNKFGEVKAALYVI